jgi:hypothetical protein
LLALLSATNASQCRNSPHHRLSARIYAESGTSGPKTTGEAVKPCRPAPPGTKFGTSILSH